MPLFDHNDRGIENMFKKIGRRLFLGFMLIYGVTLLASGTEFITRRSVIGNYEYLERVVNRLNQVVDSIIRLTAELDANYQTYLATRGESWLQEMRKMNAELEAKYKDAMQLASDDPQTLQLLQTARDESARQFSKVVESVSTNQDNNRRVASGLTSLSAATELTHQQLSDRLRTRRQQFVNEIHTLSDKADRLFLVVLISTLLFIAVLSVRIPQAIGRRIRALVQATKELEAGHYIPHLQSHSEDEFGDLARAFDRMAQALGEKEEQLRQSLKALEAVNKNLETIVDERTSQLRAAQEELIKKGKLSMLGTLAGSIGHELRNPLSVMTTSVYFLEKMLPESDGKIKKHLEMLAHQISAANRIITNLLDFTRTKEPSREETDVNELVREAAHRSSIPRAVQLKLNFSDEAPRILVDPTQINQVLMNLISNAVQAMPRGGDLAIDVDRSNGAVQVIVSDTGGGISEENRAKIFQPLFTTKQKGIGLGLAVSRKIVEANSGQIDFESEMGQGTRFSLQFPALGSEQEDKGSATVEARV
jgi:signal transduction histidine kinase